MLLPHTYLKGAIPRVDSRNIPALGRIGDPDDIIGTVLVEGGKVKEVSDDKQGVPEGIAVISHLEELRTVWKEIFVSD